MDRVPRGRLNMYTTNGPWGERQTHTTTSQAEQSPICYCGVNSPSRARVGFDKIVMGSDRREAPRRLPVHTLGAPPREMGLSPRQVDCPPLPRHSKMVGEAEYQPTVDRA